MPLISALALEFPVPFFFLARARTSRTRKAARLQPHPKIQCRPRCVAQLRRLLVINGRQDEVLAGGQVDGVRRGRSGRWQQGLQQGRGR